MKKYILLIVFLFVFVGVEQTEAAKPRFFITTSALGDANGKEAASYIPYFLTQVFNLLKKTYPCAELNDISTVGTLLDWERQKQLLGSGSDENLLNIAQSLGCDYLISLEVTVTNNMANISAVCLDIKKVNALSRAKASGPHGTEGLNAVKNVSKELIDGLKTYEICPFKGDINVKIVGTKKDNQTEQYPVYCNGMDGTFKKITIIDNYSENDWKITKMGKESATGFVKFNLSEEFTIEEDNPCYECSPKKQGNRSYKEKTTTYADIQGLSNESESYGVRVDDARAYLTFFDNGTYTLRIKASSTQAEKKTKKEVTAQGTCDNLNDPPETITNKIDEGINEIFGPFTGTAQDKVLSHKDTIKRVNPITDEEETITYEFNLTRE